MLFSTVGFTFQGYSQPDEGPKFLSVTTVHWNLNIQNFSMDEWKTVEKEYFDKVTSRNQYILTSLFLMHYFTEDNTEIKIVNGYRAWEDIEKAEESSSELSREAWPDKAGRDAFFKKQSAYYTNMHSDEIYSNLPFV
jgi:hypothetical protein